MMLPLQLKTTKFLFLNALFAVLQNQILQSFTCKLEDNSCLNLGCLIIHQMIPQKLVPRPWQ